MTRKERRELEQKEKNRSRKRMLTILEIIFLIILIISLVKIVTWQIENNKSKKLLDTISENIKVIKNEETGKIEEYKIVHLILFSVKNFFIDSIIFFLFISSNWFNFL